MRVGPTNATELGGEPAARGAVMSGAGNRLNVVPTVTVLAIIKSRLGGARKVRHQAPGLQAAPDRAPSPAAASARPRPRCAHAAVGARLPAPTCRDRRVRCWGSGVRVFGFYPKP